MTSTELHSTIAAVATQDEADGALPLIPGYEVLQLLGRGGMGTVYLALDAQLGREVAIKTLRAGASPELIARFREEVTALAAIHHPNVLQVHQAGASAGLPYLVMEYVAGGTLAKALDRKPLASRDAALLLEPIARAIQVCHERGILHRDLKPGNILLAEPTSGPASTQDTVRDQLTGEVSSLKAIPKVADFGLAKRLSEDAGLTKTGDVLGTPAYMAPEQATGVVSKLGPAVDIYALGAILFEMLTGRPPFQSPDPVQTLMMVISLEPVPPRQLQPKLPRDIETICLKCLEKSPRKRYASATELAEDLRRFLDGRPIVARPIRVWEKAIKWAKRRPAYAGLIAVSILACLMIGIGGVSYNARLRSAKDNLESSNTQLAAANTSLESSNNKLAAELNRSEQMFVRGHQLVRFLLHEHTNILRTLKGSTSAQRDLVTQLLPYLDHLAGLIEGHDRIPGDITIPELATAYESLASVQGHPGEVSLGDTGAATRTFEKALALRRSYFSDHPQDVTAAAAVARCLSMLADVDMATGNRTRCRMRNLEALKLLDGLPRDPSNASAIEQIKFTVRGGLAELEIADGALKDGLASYRAMLPDARKRHEAFPQEWLKTWNLAQVLARIAELEAMSDDLAAAKLHYKEALDLSESLNHLDVDDVRFYRELAVNFLGYGDLLVDEHKYAEANKPYEAAVAMLRRLAALDPNGRTISRDLSIALEKHGRGLNIAGKPKEGVPLLEESVRLLREYQRDAKQTNKRLGLRITLTSLGTCYGELNRFEDQRRCYQEALELATADSDLVGVAEVHLHLGLSFEDGNKNATPDVRLGELLMAVKHYDASLAGFANLAKQSPLLPSQGRLRAIAEKQRMSTLKKIDALKASRKTP